MTDAGAALLQRFLDFVEWGRVCEAIARRAASNAGREWARALRPSCDAGEVARRQARTREAGRLLAEGGLPDLSAISDLPRAFERAERQLRGSNARELRAVAITLRTGAAARAAFAGAPALAALVAAADAPEDEALAATILERIGPHGVVQDGASEALGRLRAAKAAARAGLKQALTRLCHEPSLTRVVAEHRPVEHERRLCLKIKRSEARRVPGQIVAEQGDALLVEPDGLHEDYARLRYLELDEREEEARIAAELDAMVAPRRADYERLAVGLILADVHAAMARLAGELELVAPEPAAPLELELRAARHPLLLAEREGCVPIDVAMSDARRLLVISGPNGGGKTAAMKTVGLLAALAQCGAHVPAERARLPVFAGFLAVGNDGASSVHEGLSTFQAHARHLTEVCEASRPGCLVLLDEIGLGTDPAEAAALAQAFLEDQLRRELLTLATTHLSPLKAFAERTPTASNAAVALDEAGRPTFTLHLGQAGRSYALEAARQAGLPEAIYARAAELHAGGAR